jgi:hypothetical protein
MSNGIQNVRQWAVSYAQVYKAMPSKQDIDAMATANGVLSHIVEGICQLAIMEVDDIQNGFISPDELEGIA